MLWFLIHVLDRPGRHPAWRRVRVRVRVRLCVCVRAMGVVAVLQSVLAHLYTPGMHGTGGRPFLSIVSNLVSHQG